MVWKHALAVQETVSAWLKLAGSFGVGAGEEGQQRQGRGSTKSVRCAGGQRLTL